MLCSNDYVVKTCYFFAPPALLPFGNLTLLYRLLAKGLWTHCELSLSLTVFQICKMRILMVCVAWSYSKV